jgi:hypothetical protein
MLSISYRLYDESLSQSASSDEGNYQETKHLISESPKPKLHNPPVNNSKGGHIPMEQVHLQLFHVEQTLMELVTKIIKLNTLISKISLARMTSRMNQ